MKNTTVRPNTPTTTRTTTVPPKGYCDHCANALWTDHEPVQLPIDIASKITGEYAVLCDKCEHFVESWPKKLRARRSQAPKIIKPLTPTKRPHPGRSMSEVLHAAS